MTKLISDIYLGRAKNAQHDEYMVDTQEEAKTCPAIVQLLPTQLAAFQAAVAHEHRVISTPIKYETSPEILEKDRQRDHALSILRSAMRAQTGYPDAAVAQAAAVVLRMSDIDKISGSEQYDEQTGKITEMMTLLLGTYAEQVETAMLMPFVQQLKTLNDEMCQMLIDREKEEGERGPRLTVAARSATDTAYRELILCVNSVSYTIDLGLFHPAGFEGNPFTGFIDFMVGHIARYNREVLKTSSSSSNKPGGSTTEEVEEEVTEEEETENGGNTPGGTLKPDPDAPGTNPNPTPGEGNGENEDEYTPPDNDGGFGKAEP